MLGDSWLPSPTEGHWMKIYCSCPFPANMAFHSPEVWRLAPFSVGKQLYFFLFSWTPQVLEMNYFTCLWCPINLANNNAICHWSLPNCAIFPSLSIFSVLQEHSLLLSHLCFVPFSLKGMQTDGALGTQREREQRQGRRPSNLFYHVFNS